MGLGGKGERVGGEAPPPPILGEPEGEMSASCGGFLQPRRKAVRLDGAWILA